MTDRLTLLDDNELRMIIAELDDALDWIGGYDFPEPYNAVKAAADYLAALRERRHATQTQPQP